MTDIRVSRKACCEKRINYGMPRSVDDNSAVAALSALGFPTRLAAVKLVVASGDSGLPAGEIARQLQIPQNTLSDHLQALVQARILINERRGTSIFYKPINATLHELISFLDQKCIAHGR